MHLNAPRYVLALTMICGLSFSLNRNVEGVDDWPQILGPNRNGVAKNVTLASNWPETGPVKKWERNCGQGFAGVAVSKNQLALFHRVGTSDLVELLNATDGKLIWKNEIRSRYAGGVSGDLGPRCVPLIAENQVIVMDAAGNLRSLDRKSGELNWERKLFTEYLANLGYFGAGSAPLLLGNRLVCIVGGRNAGIVCLNLENGETIWKTESVSASYAAPVALKFNDADAIACLNKLSLQILSLADGKLLYETEFGKRGPTVNAATPIVFDDKLFLSAAYQIGGRLIDLKTKKVVWENDSSLSSQYPTPVLVDGNFYGCNGREDFRNGSLRCVDFSTGKVKWSQDATGMVHVIAAGGHLLVCHVDGRLSLVKADPNRYDLIQEVQVFSGNAKSLPALSNGFLYLKSNSENGPGRLVCLQVGADK